MGWGFSLYNLYSDMTVYEEIQNVQDMGEHDLQYYGKVISARPSGSGQNGPRTLDGGLGVSVIKKDWPQNSTAGELNGIYSVVRNGNGDASAYMADVATNDDSHAVILEGHSTKLAASGWPKEQQLVVQLGAINRYGAFGYFVKAQGVKKGVAIKISGSFPNYILFSDDRGVPVARLDSNGNLYLRGKVFAESYDRR